MKTTFVPNTLYDENCRIAGYQAIGINAQGYRNGETRPVQPTMREAILEAETAGWMHYDDGVKVAIMDNCGTGGLFSMRDLGMQR